MPRCSPSPRRGTTRKSFPTEEAKQRAVVAEADKVLATYGAGPLRRPGDRWRRATPCFALERVGQRPPRSTSATSKVAPKDDTLRFGALDGLGLVAEAKGDLPGAAKAYERMAQEAPKLADRADLERARVLASAGKVDEARQLLAKFGESAQGLGAGQAGRPAARAARGEVRMFALALALLLGWPPEPEGLATRLPPAPLSLYSVAWRLPLLQANGASPIEEGGVAVDHDSGLAVFGTRDGWLHASGADGTRAWEFRAGGAFPAAPAIDGDTVYAGSSDGRVYALSLADGKQRWSYDAREEMGTRPVVAGGTVFVMSLQDTLFALDARTGEWKWLHRREARGIDRGFTIRGAAQAAGARRPRSTAPTRTASWRRSRRPPARSAGSGPWRPAGEYTDVDGLWAGGGPALRAAYSGAVLALDAATRRAGLDLPRPLGLPGDGGAAGSVVAVGASSSTASPRRPASRSGASRSAARRGRAGLRRASWLLVPAQDGGLRFVEPSTGRTLRDLRRRERRGRRAGGGRQPDLRPLQRRGPVRARPAMTAEPGLVSGRGLVHGNR